MNRINIAGQKSFRYIRLVPAKDTTVKIAEIQFYSGNSQTKGCYIGPQQQKADSIGTLLFDGNILTYYETRSADEWVGVDLGRPHSINSIAFCPHTDDNEIIPGERYQLRYWDDGWKSTTEVIADDYIA